MALRIDPVFKVIAGFYAAKFVAKKADRYLDDKIDRLNRTQRQEPAVTQIPVPISLVDMRQYINTPAAFARWLMQELISSADMNDKQRFQTLTTLYAPKLSDEGKQILWNTAIISSRELKKSSTLTDCQHALVLHDVCAEMY